MAEMKHWKQVYVTTDSPVDDAGNYYYMAMVPEGTKVYLPITDQAPDEALGNRGLKYNWSNNTWEVSDQDPVVNELNALKGQVKALLIGQTFSNGGALNLTAPTTNTSSSESESNTSNSESNVNSASLNSSTSGSMNLPNNMNLGDLGKSLNNSDLLNNPDLVNKSLKDSISQSISQSEAQSDSQSNAGSAFSSESSSQAQQLTSQSLSQSQANSESMKEGN